MQARGPRSVCQPKRDPHLPTLPVHADEQPVSRLNGRVLSAFVNPPSSAQASQPAAWGWMTNELCGLQTWLAQKSKGTSYAVFGTQAGGYCFSGESKRADGSIHGRGSRGHSSSHVQLQVLTPVVTICISDRVQRMCTSLCLL